MANLNKKSLLIFLALSMVILTACGGNDSNSTDKEDQLTLTFAGNQPIDHMITDSMDSISEEVQEKTNDKLKLDVYPADQLGGYTSVLEEVMEGTIDMALIPIISDHEPFFEVVYLPYLANNYDEAEKVFSEGSELYDIMDEQTKKNNLKLLGFHADGFAGIGSTEEIKNPLSTDKKDVLLRIASLKTYEASAKELGFNGMSIPYEDIYTSLQTGIIDASMGQSVPTTYHGFLDAISYYYKYNITFDTATFIVNQDLWDSLPEEEKEIIQNTANKHLKDSYAKAEKEEEEYTQKLVDEGIEIVEFEEDELNELSNKFKTEVWREMEDLFGAEVITQLQKD